LAQDLAIRATSNLFADAWKTPAVQSLAQRLENGGVSSGAGLSLAAQPFVAALLQKFFPGRCIMVVTDSLKTQESFAQDLETWSVLKDEVRRAKGEPPSSTFHPPSSPLFYPAWEVLPHETRLPHADTISDRLQTLVALSENSKLKTKNSKLIVTSVAALLQRTFAPETLRAGTRTMQRGDRLDPLDLAEWLEQQGYEPEAQVTQKGELALRGGILDVYPLASPWPVRLEFFGDELESLRSFDPVSQMSREEITSVVLPPAGELGILKKVSGARCQVSGKAGAAIPPPDTSHLAPDTSFGTLLDYLPRESILVLCEPELLAERAEEYAQQVQPGDPFFINWTEFRAQAAARQLTTLEISEADAAGARDHQTALNLTSLEAFRPLPDRAPEPHVAERQRSDFFDQMHRWLRQGYAVHVFCNNDGERQRFEEIWEEMNVGQASRLSPSKRDPATAVDSATTSRLKSLKKRDRRDACPALHLGSLTRGFLFEDARLVVVTDAEIFGRYKIQRPRRLKSPHALATRSALDIDFTELEEGDLVVHLQHGIGRYLGLQSLPTRTGATSNPQSAIRNPQSEECLVIEYAANDPAQSPPKLYVPVTEAHLVGKYVGAGKARPPLNTLGGTRWRKAKEQAERAVRDVAGDLLAIQAARESQPGHAFKPDTAWQREFEGAFIYEETPDQLRAIEETKADMERARPMDRLICGDVGFGKTEVAIRAAFKTVMDGRQVAVLVPTTVLAQQHFNTFRERMADYPVRIELLSRFLTRRQQQRVVKDLAAGAVDIVIGTHRLVQSDISFKDLGLVVIDEEQRFGVMHKEQFKVLRRMVDVLTLSATPIPRTLYLALSGARDMSTIQTPPQDRLPVETIATPYDERLIRDAIQRELNRGGQVFFLHNRVMTIQTVEQKLRALVPRARIVVGHGQMHSDELEEVMTQFVNGEADVLLSTTIIESGLDIPNANTIIIDRADRFGLSDLYQLRGRVGRYKHQAYAYLLLPRHARLFNDVRRRISAIKQYSTPGSGFKIAMRDLEIRGAGNLLGAEQSGHITAVGFELYCQLLKQSVSSLKGEKVKPRIMVEVRLDFITLNSTGGASSHPSAVSSTSDEEGDARDQSTGSGSSLRSRRGDEPEACGFAEDSASSPRPLRAKMNFETSATDSPLLTADQTPAFLPQSYVTEPRHRIEMYRKLAQLTDHAALDALKNELSDRFGPAPPPAELLLQIAELKIVAAERGVTVIETREDRLMLTRNNDYIMIGGKFPRLTRKTATGKTAEIKRLLLAL
jgi:transcription-repair coupling factor (superfamily II helicase)